MMLRLWGERCWLAGRVESVIVERRFVCGVLGRNAAVGDWWYLRRRFSSSFRWLKQLARHTTIMMVIHMDILDVHRC
jgi:hypothetical protein